MVLQLGYIQQQILFSSTTCKSQLYAVRNGDIVAAREHRKALRNLTATASSRLIAPPQSEKTWHSSSWLVATTAAVHSPAVVSNSFARIYLCNDASSFVPAGYVGHSSVLSRSGPPSEGQTSTQGTSSTHHQLHCSWSYDTSILRLPRHLPHRYSLRHHPPCCHRSPNAAQLLP